MWAIQKGFTVVELLVVIVLIAILATIAVMTVSGIQDRAYVTKVNTVGSQFAKAIASYQAANGRYPYQGLGIGYCLGKPSDYPAQDGFVASSCIRPALSGDSTDPFINSELDTITSGLSAAGVKPVRWDDAYEYNRGYTYSTGTFGPGSWAATIRWSFTGVKSCGAGTYESLDSGATTGCYITLRSS